jgi:hypothetical protein
MSLDIYIKPQLEFSTVAGFHYFTIFTTSPSELAKVFASMASVNSTFIPFNSAPLATRARYTKLEVFARVSPSGSEYSEVVKPSLGCRSANGYGNSTVFPCLHEKARWGGA